MIRPILAIAFKDVKLAYNDGRDIILHLLVPVCVGSILGFAMSGMASKDLPTAKICVIDQAGTEASGVFVNRLKQAKNLECVDLPREKALDTLRLGKLNAVLEVSKGFDFEKLYRGQSEGIKLYVDPSRQMLAAMVEGLVQRAGFETLGELMFKPERASTFLKQAEADIDKAKIDPELKVLLRQMLRNNGDFMSEIRRLEREGKASSSDFPFLGNGIKTQVESVGDQGKNYFAVIFPGIAVMFMLFSSMGGALGLLKEKWLGVLRRILAAPVTRFQLIAGKSLGIFLTTMIQFYVYLGFFMLAWGVRPNGSIPGLVLMSIALCACCASLSMMLASLGRSESGVHAASLLVILGMSALGGSMIPYSVMPPTMQQAASFTINKWAIVGLDACIWRGVGFSEMIAPLCVLCGLTIVFLAVGAKLLRL